MCVFLMSFYIDSDGPFCNALPRDNNMFSTRQQQQKKKEKEIMEEEDKTIKIEQQLNFSMYVLR